MKIAIVHKNVNNSGGAERYMKDLAVLFARRGFNVSVYASKFDIIYDRKIIFHKIKIVRFSPVLKTLSFAINSKRKLLKEKHDVIIAMGNVYYQDIYCLGGGVYSRYVLISLLKYKTFFGKIFRYLRRMLSPSHWLKLHIEKKVFTNNKTKLFICPSKFVANDLAKAYKIDGSKIKTVINGVDVEKFRSDGRDITRKIILRKFGFSNSNFIFLFVSSNHFLKGLEPLLDAFCLLNKEQKNARMIVVGKGRENYFKKKSEKMHLTSFVKFAGWQQDTREFYRAADFFVYPSFYDTFANVALESLSCGTPLIVSSLAGASEVIEEHKNGFVIKNPRNSAEILDKMKTAMSLSKKELTEMSVCARRTAENYSNEKHIDRIMELLREVCQS